MIRDYQALQRTWFEKGKQRIIRTTGKHRGVKLLSTVDYDSGRIVWHEDEVYNAETFLTFLSKVLEAYPTGTITMVLDNARIHHAKLLKPFLDENKRLTFVFLPLLLPLSWLTYFQNWITQPLGSATFSVGSSLLRAIPPLYFAFVLSPLRDFRLDFSIHIGVVGSHIPNKSLCYVHAAFMPVTIWTVNRFPPGSSQANDSLLVLMTSLRFRHFISH